MSDRDKLNALSDWHMAQGDAWSERQHDFEIAVSVAEFHYDAARLLRERARLTES